MVIIFLRSNIFTIKLWCIFINQITSAWPILTRSLLPDRSWPFHFCLTDLNHSIFALWSDHYTLLTPDLTTTFHSRLCHHFTTPIGERSWPLPSICPCCARWSYNLSITLTACRAGNSEHHKVLNIHDQWECWIRILFK